MTTKQDRAGHPRALNRRAFMLAGVSAATCAAAYGVAQAVLGSSGPAPSTSPGAPDAASAADGPAPVITAAYVEENGWVLAIEGMWPASTFEPLNPSPNFQPQLSLDVRAAGHETGSGIAVPATRSRRVVATKPLRRSVAGPPRDLVSLDEASLGNGVRRLRFALSEFVHQGEEVRQLDVGASWRAGAQAQALTAIPNRSNLPVELPSMRWATPSQMRVTRTADMRIDLVVASAFAEGLQAVAAVRFTATDGARANSVWQSAPSTSDQWGDRLRCWGVTAAASGLLDGLTPGVVTVHAELYPFIGAMRRTGTGHEPNTARGYGYGAESPLHIVWDPDGRRHPERHVYVDPINGSLTWQAVTVAATLDAARAGMAARNVSVAMAAIYMQNVVVPPANGRPGGQRAGDNAVITLAPGLHDGVGAMANPSAAKVHDCRLVIQGDPRAAQPRDTCILRLTAAGPRTRYDLLWLRNFKIQLAGGQLPERGGWFHFDNMVIEGAPGSETLVTSPVSAPPVGELRCTATSTLWWRSGGGFSGTNSRWRLLRGCAFTNIAGAPLMVNCRTVRDDSAPVVTSSLIQPPVLTGAPDLAADQILWGCSIRGLSGRGLTFPVLSERVIRFRMVNNLFERRAGTDPQPIASLGEGAYQSAIDCLIEGNTFVGQRLNWAYNDPPSADPVRQNVARGNRFRNNYLDRMAAKHDAFFSPRFRNTRPGFTACWSILYGVGYEGVVTANRFENDENFPYEWPGLTSVVNPVASATQGNSVTLFVDDRSRLGGGDATGFGDYRPGAGSELANRVRRACIDVDQSNTPRVAPFATGAFVSV